MEEELKNKLLVMSEIDIFFIIDECGAFKWRMNHDMAHGRIAVESHAAIQKDIVNIQEIQEFAVSTLDRFGIDPKSAEDKPDGDYWKWFTFWNNWKKSLSNEDWNAVGLAMENKKLYDEYLPKNKWNEKK